MITYCYSINEGVYEVVICHAVPSQAKRRWSVMLRPVRRGCLGQKVKHTHLVSVARQLPLGRHIDYRYWLAGTERIHGAGPVCSCSNVLKRCLFAKDWIITHAHALKWRFHKANFQVVFHSYFTAVDWSFPQADFFSKRHHAKCCRQTPFKFHVDNLEEHKTYTSTIRHSSFIFSGALILRNISIKGQIACKAKSHLVAADVIITLVDAAAVGPTFQGLGHWFNVWVRVGTYHVDRPACVTLTHTHTHTARIERSPRQKKTTESMVFSPLSLVAGIFCVPSKGNQLLLSTPGSYQPHLLAGNQSANTDAVTQSLQYHNTFFLIDK